MGTIWLPPALVCYALSAAGFVAGRTANRPRWTDQAVPLLGAAVLFHTLALVTGALNAGNIPVTNFAQSLSFLAWLTAIVSFVLISRMRMQVLGAFVAPGVLAAVGAAMLLMRRGRLVIPDSLRSAWLPVHVTLAFLGYALFVLAAGVSLVYLVYEWRLKAKRPLAPADRRAESGKTRSHQLSPAGLGLPDADAGDYHRRHLGGRDVGPFLVVGAAGILVAGHLADVRRAARIAADGGMARAAGRGADDCGVRCWSARSSA